jgi:hypothetical protein
MMMDYIMLINREISMLEIQILLACENNGRFNI